MSITLRGSNAIVTGSSRGIGRAIALELARRGANVVVCCQSRVDAALEVKEECEAMGVRALVVQSDLATEEGCRLVADRCVKELGGVDVLVNNAGIGQFAPVHQLESEAIERTLRVNLFSYIYMSKYAVGDMIERQVPGCVINISSVVSMIGASGMSVYAASKGAITGFTVCLAREVARYGIRVNAIAPGYVETELIAPFPDDYRAKVIKRIPMRRFGEPNEIARAIPFLVEDATYMTGQTLVIDGGILIE